MHLDVHAYEGNDALEKWLSRLDRVGEVMHSEDCSSNDTDKW